MIYDKFKEIFSAEYKKVENTECKDFDRYFKYYEIFCKRNNIMQCSFSILQFINIWFYIPLDDDERFLDEIHGE